MKKYDFSYEYIDYMNMYRLYDKRIPYQTIGYEDSEEEAKKAVKDLAERFC